MFVDVFIQRQYRQCHGYNNKLTFSIEAESKINTHLPFKITDSINIIELFYR